jgi:hypothetical protein
MSAFNTNELVGKSLMKHNLTLMLVVWSLDSVPC